MSHTFFRDNLKFGNVKCMYIVIRKVSSVLPNWSVIVKVSVLIKYYTFVFKKKKKNAANNALCSPPVVGKRKKEDGGFRKQLTLSRPINFSVQKDKWLVFSTKWICSKWGRWKVLVKMHIIIHMSVNHWEPGFFFLFNRSLLSVPFSILTWEPCNALAYQVFFANKFSLLSSLAVRPPVCRHLLIQTQFALLQSDKKIK